MLSDLEIKDVPKPLPLRKLIGPSFILLGLGLGSGELILWPYLSSNFGLGIIWAAVLGITIQYFLNMEIVRYTIANGESIFVGMKRKFGNIAPIFFIFSSLLPWMWPGIAASSAFLFVNALGIGNEKIISIFILLLIGLVLTLGKIIYKTEEIIQKTIILVGIPIIVAFTIMFFKLDNAMFLFKGFVGIGEGYKFLPKDIPLATFLAALAYAGAGGTLNLTQSFYAKEKGYAMGAYTGRLTGLVGTNKEEMRLTGTTFEHTNENLARFRLWWKRINIEHALVFWLTGAITIILLSFLAYSIVYKNPNTQSGINFIILESEYFSTVSYFLKPLFLFVSAAMLFGTQFSVFAATSRISSENLVLIDSKKFPVKKSSIYFFIFLWLQIILGIVIFSLGITEPLTLVVIGACLNAVTMFIYSGLIYIVNTKLMKKDIAPGLFRRFALIFAFIFYGGFSLFTVYNLIVNL